MNSMVREERLPIVSVLQERTRPFAQAVVVALAFFLIAGTVEAGLIRIIQPTEMELDWISDVVLSTALGTAVYLWLHLRVTRLTLTERERSQLVIETQLSLAEAMQRRLLPQLPAPSEGFDWAASLSAAGSIGGDFYDFIQPNEHTRLMLIADVSGKGISAAMALTLLRATFRNIARSNTSPAHLAQQMSQAFYDEWNGSPYVTCIVARIDLRYRTVTYTNAGHPPGLLVRGGSARDMREGGPPLGLLPSARYSEDCIALKSGDVCVFMTDGITEALDDVSVSLHAVRAATFAHGARPHTHVAARVCDTIMATAADGPGPAGVDDWADDRTVIVLALS